MMVINDAVVFANSLENLKVWENQTPKQRRRYLINIANKIADWEEREEILCTIAGMTEDELMTGIVAKQ